MEQNAQSQQPAQPTAEVSQTPQPNVATGQKPVQTQGPAPTQEEKVWGLLSYLPMVALVTLVIKPKSEFCKIHGTQGLVLTVLEFIVMFVWAIIPTIGSLFVLALFVLVVFGAFKAVSGVYFKIPGVYQVAQMVPVDALTAGVVTPSSQSSEVAQAEVDGASRQESVAFSGADVAPQQPAAPAGEVAQGQPKTPEQVNPQPPVVPPAAPVDSDGNSAEAGGSGAQ